MDPRESENESRHGPGRITRMVWRSGIMTGVVVVSNRNLSEIEQVLQETVPMVNADFN
jgi:hypothetical protein